jgi:glutathionyl-hydroquinone reductase
MRSACGKEQLRMGLLVNGIWRDEQAGERTPGGRFERPATRFRNWVPRTGAPARPAKAASRLRAGAIISTSRTPAPGRTAP